MKILIVTPYYTPSIGGVQNYVASIVANTNKKHNLTIITAKLAGAKDYEVIDGVEIYRLTPWMTISNTPISPLWFFKIKRIINKLNPDIIYAHSPVPFIADCAILASGKIPTILTYHAGSMAKGLLFKDAIIKLYEKLILPRIFKKVDKIAAVYPQYVESILGNNDKIHFIPPGIDLEVFKPNPKLNKIYDLLFVGRIEKTSDWKGLDILLQSVSLVKSKFPNIKLQIIGQGSAVDTYKKQVDKLHLSRNVSFKGAKRTKGLLRVYNNSKILVMPSKTDAESFGMVAAESMACNTPVIASDVGGVSNLVIDKKNGLLVQPGNVRQLADAIITLLGDTKLRNRIGKNGRITISKSFSQKQLFKNINNILKDTHRIKKKHYSIIQVAGHYPPFLGGMELRIKELSEKLSQNGHNVSVFTSDQGSKPHKENNNKLQVSYLRSIELAHTPIIPSLLFKLLFIKKSSIVHVHIAHAFVPEIVSFVCRLRKIPYIAHVRLDVPASGLLGRLLLPPYKKLILSKVLKHSKYVIVLTPDYKNLISNKYSIEKDRIFIIPNATEHTIATSVKELPNDIIKILFVGRLASQKNIPLLLQSLKIVSEKFKMKKFELMIVGDGELKDELIAQTEMLGLDKQVSFVGALSGKDLEASYSNADIFVLSSTHESFGTVLIEAMAKGLPIIASRIDAVKNTIINRRNGLLSEQNPDSFADAIIELSTNRDLYAKISANNIQKSKRYDWKTVLSKTLNVYSKLEPKKRKARPILLSIPLLFAATFLSFTNNSSYGLNPLLWIGIITIFGYLILSTLNIKRKLNSSEFLTYIYGLAIVGLFVFGITINTIGHIFGLTVISTNYILPSFMALFLTLMYIHIKKPVVNIVPSLSLSNGSKLEIIWSLIPLLFPLLASAGAIRLNNGSDNTIIIFTLILITLYQVITAFKFKDRTDFAYVINIFFLGLALLLSVSLRSNFLMGFDIHQEFRVFQDVLNNGIWNPRAYADNTYNACLSITLLPAILQNLFAVSSDTIFRFFMQLIAALLPVAVFGIAKKQLKNSSLAFIASMLFMFQSQYIFQLPALIRQQTAMFMFAIMIGVIINKAISRKQTFILASTFGLGIVLSHYSSSYISLAILFLYFILSIVLKYYNMKQIGINPTQKNNWVMVFSVIAILSFSSFIWYGVVVGSSGSVIDKLSSSLQSIGKHSNDIGSTLSNNIGSSSEIYNKSSIVELSRNRPNIPKSQKYENANDSTAKLEPVYPELTQINSLPESILMTTFYKIWPLIIRAVLLVGIIYTISLWIKHKLSTSDISLIIATCIVIGIFMLLPGLALEYNIERLYQQSLVLLVGVIVLGFSLFNKTILSRYTTPIMLTIVLGYFVSTTGVIRYIASGRADINLSNSGETFDRYYTYANEVRALKWLELNNDGERINFDRYSILRAQAYTSIPIAQMAEGMLPTDIGIDSYVYASNTNTKKQVVFDSISKKLIMYNFPSSFVEERKDTIYSSGDTRIYK